ncbi:uncharacterized protein K02A2.6-like [Macrosteles quadrilineatus]|uniref:uncharacterized protein K02A2.6-like n=1 Tax=Macrosteles quadrilineatus TaxID=74068 RepID=UPI0023E0AEDA|nr:uncharacterized protein K02A2.6-like [Macrosteles quadrilineatus]
MAAGSKAYVYSSVEGGFIDQIRSGGLGSPEDCPSDNYPPSRFLRHIDVRDRGCAQKEGEAVSEFAVQLKKLASTCDFKEFLDDALRDRFLCGLRSNEIQSRLLSEGDTLTFDKALQLALVLEDASRSRLSVLGEFQARVTNNDTTLDLPMVIIRSETPNQPVLLGRNWLNRIKLDWGKLVKDNNLDGRQVKDKDMSVMDKILAGIENVHCYLDDILITSQSFEDMYEKVKEVLSRLQQYGVRINAGKSEFFRDSLTFLGHRLDARGIYPSEELTADIVKAPRPTDLTQLRSYIGLLNYYGKFLPNLSTLLHPLYNLLNKGVKWSWSEECERAFQKSKELLLTNKVLIPFNPKLDIVVMADASPYGVGGVISHRLPDGSEKPIAFGSRTLSVHEARYSQIEKEALALVFVVKKFHTFLYGRRFILATDHRPLTFLLGHNKSIPTLAAARIQRWALTLAAYDYELVYRKGSDMCNADAMSRLPCNVDCNPDEVVAFFSSIDEMPITFKEISLATRHDPVLSKVLDYTLNGWPSYNNNPQLKPYFSRSTELSVEQDCLLWGRRVVIPAPHRKEVLALLHKEHPGESRMKNLARSYVWWPNMDNDLEEMVKNCFICQSTRNSLQLAPLQQWSWPKHCWQRIHIDFASFHNKEFLIIIDSFSKWMEVFYMTSITSAKTIEKLRTCFSAYGLPSTLVSDGGPQLNSKEFDDFLKANAILHVVTPPYHPASNGLAERAVQTTKKSFIRQLLHDEKSGEPRALQHRIDSFLFAYRNTPHSTTGIFHEE